MYKEKLKPGEEVEDENQGIIDHRNSMEIKSDICFLIIIPIKIN